MGFLRSRILSCLVLAASASVSAAAEQAKDAVESRIVKFDLSACAVIEKDEETAYAVKRCADFDGYDFYVAHGDLRDYVGFGPDAVTQKAFTQTLTPFNRIDETIEFRVRAGAAVPEAAIIRYFIDNEATNSVGQVLVVSKIAGTEACHVAYVDALANANAEDLARRAADESRDFDCETDEPRIVGSRSRGEM